MLPLIFHPHSIARALYVRFDADPRKLQDWRDHLGLPSHPLPPDARYARILPHLLKAKNALVSLYGWSDASKLVDDDMLFAVQKVSRGSLITLAIPRSLDTFWEYEDEFAQMFHSAVFLPARSKQKGLVLSPDMDPPLASMFYYLQLVVPGMCAIIQDEAGPDGVRRIARALPPDEWLIRHEHQLCDALGSEHYLSLVRCSLDRSTRTGTVDDVL